MIESGIDALAYFRYAFGMFNRALSWFICLSIRVQLLLLLLLVMLPSAGIVINSAFHKQTENINETRADLWQIADFIVHSQQDIAFSTQQLGSSLANIPEVAHFNVPLLSKILTDRIKINPYCSGVVIANRFGTVITSVPIRKNLYSIANRRSFKNAKTSRLFSSGEYSAEVTKEGTIFSFSYPLTAADGSFNGVIEIEMNQNLFKNILKTPNTHDKTDFTIVDHHGVILYSHLYPDFVGKRDREETFTLMRKGGDGGAFFTAFGIDGILSLSCFRHSQMEHERTPYLFIRTSKSKEAVTESADKDLLLNILTLGAITIAAFFLVYIIGKRSIADRIKALEGAARKLAEGDLTTRVLMDVAGGELGKLARTFDQMAEQLEERDQRLKAFENELVAANSKLHALHHKIELTREDERRTIARELHDQMGQALTGLGLDLNWLTAQLDKNTVQKFNCHIIDMHLTVENMIGMVQSITARLSPPLLDDLGLAAAIGHYVQDFERKSDIICHLMLDEDASGNLGKEETVAVFRILQESLTNVARHASADEVAVSSCLTAHFFILEIADNGIGTTQEAICAPNAFGVLGMQERAIKCGGTLRIHDNSGGGTVVRLEIPQQKKGINNESIGS